MTCCTTLTPIPRLLAVSTDFKIREGRKIRVWPATEATQKDIECYLNPLGRRCVTTPEIHANAIGTICGSAAFAGHPRGRARRNKNNHLLNQCDFIMALQNPIND